MLLTKFRRRFISTVILKILNVLELKYTILEKCLILILSRPITNVNQMSHYYLCLLFPGVRKSKK